MNTTDTDVFHQYAIINSPYFYGSIHGCGNKLIWFVRMDTDGRDDPRMTIQYKNQVAGQDFEIIKKMYLDLTSKCMFVINILTYS